MCPIIDLDAIPLSRAAFPQKLGTFFLALFLVIPSTALDPNKAIAQHLIRVFWPPDLPQLTVNTLIQTSDGYIWIGTEGGLARYDGGVFHHFARKNAPGLPDDRITALEEGEGGLLWVGTSAGLCRYESCRFESFASRGPPFTNRIDWIKLDSAQRLWIGHEHGLLVLSKPEGIDHAICLELEHRFLCAHEGPAGAMWLGAADGVFSLEMPGAALSAVQDLKGLTVLALTGKGDVLWAGTDRRGLARIEDGNVTWYGIKDGLRNLTVRSLFIDAESALWIGTDQGLFRLVKEELDHPRYHEQLGRERVLCLMEDHEHSLWVGMWAGLAHIMDSRFTPFFHFTPDSAIVFPVLEDHQGRIWFGTYGEGLYVIDQGNVSRPDGSEALLAKARIWSLEELQDQTILAGSEHGIYTFDQRVWRILDSEDGPTRDRVRALHEDSQQRLWVGTDHGLALGRGRRFQRQMLSQSGNEPKVFAVFEDSRHHIWLGTSAGAFLYQETGFQKFDEKDGLSDDEVYGFHEDVHGTLWLATRDGLTARRQSHWQALNADQGLGLDEVYLILEDPVGYFWMTENKGPSRVSIQDLYDWMDGNRDTLDWVSFSEDPAWVFNGRECNGRVQSPGLIDRDGRIWLASNSGLMQFSGDLGPDNPVPPPVLVQALRWDQISHPVTQERITIPAGTKRFEIDYAGMSFIQPDRMRFRYRLLGFEDAWVDAGNHRTAFYTNVPPGEYDFEVQACNASGIWNTEGAHVAFLLEFHWWETRGFQATAIILAAAMTILIYKGIGFAVKTIRHWRRTHYFGPYFLESILGSGGSGTVHRARNIVSGQGVALKILDSDRMTPTARQRFLRESDIGREFSHPNVVPVLDHGEFHETLFIATQRVEGVTLRRFMESGLAPSTALGIFSVLLDVIQDIHQAGIIHRDIKPENVMIQHDAPDTHNMSPREAAERLKPHIKILDFGLARFTDSRSLTQNALMEGTLAYCPPENLLGQKIRSETADFYALGVVLYEMLTGSNPFMTGNSVDALTSILSSEPPAPADLNAAIPGEVSKFCCRLIAKKPSERLSTFESITTSLAELM